MNARRVKSEILKGLKSGVSVLKSGVAGVKEWSSGG